MAKTVSEAFILCTKLYNRASSGKQKKRIKKVNVKSTSYEENMLEEEDDFIPNEFSIVQCKIFDELTSTESKLVIRIIAELKQGNVLWHYDHVGDTRKTKAIKLLREKKILYETETTRIHFVNPWFIRRGSIPSVLALTLEVLKNVSRVTTDHIKTLRGSTVDVGFNQELEDY